MRVTVVGVGALGSHVVQFLRSEAVALHIVDFDRVESKNLLSQFHGNAANGKLKVQGLRDLIKFLWNRNVTNNSNKLVANNRDQILHGSDLILDCLDNAEARLLLSSYSREKGVPCLHGALAAGGDFGRVLWDTEFKPDASVPGVPTCEDGAHLPFIALTSSVMALEAQKFIRTGKVSRVVWNITPSGVQAL